MALVPLIFHQREIGGPELQSPQVVQPSVSVAKCEGCFSLESDSSKVSHQWRHTFLSWRPHRRN